MPSDNSIDTSSPSYDFSELSFFKSLLRADIFEGKLQLVDNSPELVSFIENSVKNDFEIVSYKNYADVSNVNPWFLIKNIKTGASMDIKIKDTIKNKISLAKIRKETLLKNYNDSVNSIKMGILKTKSDNYWKDLNLSIRTYEYRGIDSWFSWEWELYLPKEFVTYNEATEILNKKVRFIFNLVEIEKALLKDKINNIDEYLRVLIDENKESEEFRENFDINVITFSDIKSGYKMSVLELSDTLKNIYNEIATHGWRHPELWKNSFKVDSYSGLWFGKKILSEFSEFFDILEIDDFWFNFSSSDYLKWSNLMESDTLVKITKEDWLSLWSFSINDYESLTSEIREYDADTVLLTDKLHYDRLKTIKLYIDENTKNNTSSSIDFNNLRVNNSDYFSHYYTPNVDVTMSNVIDAAESYIKNWSFPDGLKNIVDQVNIYWKLSFSSNKH